MGRRRRQATASGSLLKVLLVFRGIHIATYSRISRFGQQVDQRLAEPRCSATCDSSCTLKSPIKAGNHSGSRYPVPVLDLVTPKSMISRSFGVTFFGAFFSSQVSAADRRTGATAGRIFARAHGPRSLCKRGLFGFPAQERTTVRLYVRLSLLHIANRYEHGLTILDIACERGICKREPSTLHSTTLSWWSAGIAALTLISRLLGLAYRIFAAIAPIIEFLSSFLSQPGRQQCSSLQFSPSQRPSWL
jgi:hypothetical protein